MEELKGHSEADEAFVLSCSYILELAKRAKELFERSHPDQKNRLLRFVFANASVEGEKLNYKLKSVFAGIIESNKTKNWLPILEHMRTDWAQEIIELGREIKLVSIVLPMQPDEVLYAATNTPLQNCTTALRIEDVD